MKSTEEVKKELFRRREEYQAKRRKHSNAAAAAGTVFAAVFLLTAVIIAPGFLKRTGGSPAGTGTTKETGTESGETHSFIAGIVAYENTLAGKCIDPLDSSLTVGDIVYVPLDYRDGGAEVNDRIRVIYTGNVAETYPLKVNILSVEYLGKCGNGLSTEEMQKLLDKYEGRTVFNPISLEAWPLYSSMSPEVWYGIMGGVTVGGNVYIPQPFRKWLDDDLKTGKNADRMYAVFVTSGTCGIGCGINNDYSVSGKFHAPRYFRGWIDGGFISETGCGINDDYSVGGKTVAEWWKQYYKESLKQLTEGGEINASGQEAWSMLKKADREILDPVLTSFPRYYINYQLPEDRMSKYGLVPRTVFALLTYDELMTICKTEYKYPVFIVPAPSDGVDGMGLDSHVEPGFYVTPEN